MAMLERVMAPWAGAARAGFRAPLPPVAQAEPESRWNTLRRLAHERDQPC
jgi:hypothetical protein